MISRPTRSTAVLLLAAAILTACSDPSSTAPLDGVEAVTARVAAPSTAAAARATAALANYERAHAALSGPTGRGIVRDDGNPLWTALGQSPIDIPLNATRKLLSTDPRFAWEPFVPEIEPGVPELKVVAETTNAHITIRGLRYDLKQFHFHRESEHAIGGRKGALEVHFVHVAESGAIAVIGVLLEVGAANAALEPIWPAVPTIPTALSSAARFNPSTLLPPSSTPYFTYSGSLTTSPFTTDLTWIVYKQPIRLSAAQLRRYAAAYPHPNARALQPLAGRTVFERVGGGRQ
jgi:carbonic anhydrase